MRDPRASSVGLGLAPAAKLDARLGVYVGGIHEYPADFDGAQAMILCRGAIFIRLHPYDKYQHKKGLAPLFDLLYESFSTTKYAILQAGTVALPSCTQP